MAKFEYPVTPATVSRSLAALCEEIAPGSSRTYVDVRPLQNALEDECFALVKSRVISEGGDSVIGWALWELPHVFVEAEFHAVWRLPTGELIDITPKQRETRRILFLRDSVRTYEGRQVNNVRRSISQDPNVAAYLRTFDEEFELMNRGKRAGQHGEIHLEVNEKIELNAIHTRRKELWDQIQWLYPTIGPYEPCYCRSGKKVKWCHGVPR